MADKLAIYNDALSVHLGRKPLPSLTAALPERLILDEQWAGVVAYCLERKMWNFGYRTVQLDASTSIEPAFGYRYAFQIPGDWVRTRKISAVETLSPPLLQVSEEAGWWYADLTPIYVQYNSNDPAFGGDLSLWPASFTDYVGLRLAGHCCKRIVGADALKLLNGPDGLFKQESDAYKVAAANCAMNDPVGFAPLGAWARSRRGMTSMLPGPGGDNPTGGSLVP